MKSALKTTKGSLHPTLGQNGNPRIQRNPQNTEDHPKTGNLNVFSAGYAIGIQRKLQSH